MEGHLSDLTDMTFGYLKVIERAENKIRGGKSRVCWLCVCTRCGNTTVVYGDSLKSGGTLSCGCLYKDKDIPQQMRNDFVNGTQISKIQSKPTAANKSGVVGVNWDKSRNKWQASIRFREHKYNLGRFADMADAIKARKEAEKKYFGGIKSGKKENECND